MERGVWGDGSNSPDDKGLTARRSGIHSRGAAGGSGGRGASAPQLNEGQ
jgi:hypothetical protein